MMVTIFSNFLNSNMFINLYKYVLSVYYTPGAVLGFE